MTHPLSETARTALPLHGTWPALVTPFSVDAETIDAAALDALVDAQIAGGVSGLVPCGTTGESPTLSEDDCLDVIRRVVAKAAGRVPVLAGTGSNSTKKTVAASKAAVAAGAHGVMVVMPYYNKPSQDGMRAHVLEVAAAVDAPIIVYNVPGRSVVDLAPETLERLCSEAPRVVGIKEATGNVMRCQEIVRRMGDRIVVMCGDDALTLPMMSVGASGVISVTSNVRPRETSLVTTLVREGRWDDARKLHIALLEVHGLLFAEPNPSPAKVALAAEGKMNASVRGPLLPGSDGLKGRLVEALARLDAAASKLAAGRKA